MATASTYQLPPPPALWSLQSARFHQMMLLGWMTMTIGCLRGSISMVIVCMITRAESTVLAVNESTTEAPWHRFFHRNHNTDLYAISLSVPEQSTIHSTYYFATLIGLFLSHFLIRRFHAKRILTFGLLLNSTGSILMPFLLIALPNWLTIVIVRALMGFGNGFVTPCSVYIVAKWFPSHEKITAITALFIGNQIGVACSMLFTSMICRLHTFGGWTIAVELYGITGLVFLVLWELYAVNKPRHSSYVTATELDHIRGKRLKKAMLNNVNTRTPFKKILLSPCAIAICACCYTQSFIVSCITAYLPTFNHAIMNIDILWNGFASSLPFFVHATSSTVFLYGFLTLRKHGISKTNIIKGYSIVATSGVSLCILAFFILTSDQFLVLALLQSAALGFLSAFLVGCIASVTAIVPQFTSFALPYTEVYTHLAAVLAPVAVEMFSKTNEFKQWSILLCLLLVLLTGIVFSLFAHGCHEIVLQPYSEHLTIQSRIRSHRELHEQEALQPIQHSKSSMEPPAVAYCGGEASIPLRYEELPLGSWNEEFTSDDEY